ncbi:MAG: ATP phosphoribosyltransferase [Bacteroidetes bacterium]|nr:ATP phosphoribosyltransferase [Bacteroidota bacterium]MCY4205737.1 ATP phosphoribosyltransferase [Bacteroidota bacterium]
MLQIALPNKGALAVDAVELIRAAGYRCQRAGRELRVLDTENQVLFYFLRPRDIATYVSNGVLDLGIIGRDFLIEQQAGLDEIISLGFGNARLCYAGPENRNLDVDQFDGLRVATSFTHLVSADLDRRNIKAEIVPLDGAVEVSIQLGVADIIADLVQTGRTLEDAGLSVIGEPILHTEAILAGRPGIMESLTDANLFVRRIQGILHARTYVMIEYGCLRSVLEEVCQITPGIESPTIAPLSKPDWVAVKALVQRAETNQIMDDLEKIGATGIVITDIRTCRV